MACTASFIPENASDVILPEPVQGGAFFERYLNTVHRITMLSLQREVPCGESFLRDIESEFELARGSDTLIAGRLIASRSPSFKQDFVRLMQVWLHAGIVYACRRLRLDGGETGRHHYSRLARTLQEFNDIDGWTHNLAWPTFVAGISTSRGDEHRCFILQVSEKMSANTRYRHYCNISRFLGELWQTEHEDWMVLAKEWERRGQPVVAM